MDDFRFEIDGRRFRATAPRDDHMGAPWEEHDGHGPVSEWTSRDKAPGELVLAEGRHSKRFYDFAEACRIARRDGWGFLPGELVTKQDGATWTAYVRDKRGAHLFEAQAGEVNAAIGAVYAAHRATMSPRAYAAGAARRDFEFLRRWCNDDWFWVGVVVEELDEDDEPTGEEESVWGIESDSRDYLEATARELAEEIVARVPAAAVRWHLERKEA